MSTPLQRKCTRRWMSLIHQPPTIFITATKLLGEADRQGGLDKSKQRHHVLFSHIAPCQQCNLYGYLLSRMHEKCKSIPHDAARHLQFWKRMAHSCGTGEPGRIQLLVFAPTDAPAASNCCVQVATARASFGPNQHQRFLARQPGPALHTACGGGAVAIPSSTSQGYPVSSRHQRQVFATTTRHSRALSCLITQDAATSSQGLIEPPEKAFGSSSKAFCFTPKALYFSLMESIPSWIAVACCSHVSC